MTSTTSWFSPSKLDSIRVEYNGDGFWWAYCSRRGVLPWENEHGWARLTRTELEQCLREARPDLGEDAILDISHDETGTKYGLRLA